MGSSPKHESSASKENLPHVTVGDGQQQDGDYGSAQYQLAKRLSEHPPQDLQSQKSSYLGIPSNQQSNISGKDQRYPLVHQAPESSGIYFQSPTIASYGEGSSQWKSSHQSQYSGQNHPSTSYQNVLYSLRNPDCSSALREDGGSSNGTASNGGSRC